MLSTRSRLRVRVANTILGTCVLGVFVVAVLSLFFGLRVVLNGAGAPQLAFVKSSASLASAIEKDRASSTASVPSPAPPEAPTPVIGEPPTDTSPVPSVVAGGRTAAPTVATDVPAADWGEFRGRLRDGHYRGTPIVTEWPKDGLKPLWHQPIGGGYASFAVAGSRAFTIEQRGGQEVVTAYDVNTGGEVWRTGWDTEFREFMGGDGPRATPTWWQGRVYALGAIGEFRALDADTGRTLWRRNILEDAQVSNLQWAMAASPLIVGSSVIVLPGGPNGHSVAAYDAASGRPLWSALNDKQAYTSPMLVTLAGRSQLLVVSARRMMGLTPDRGEVLWEYPWVTDNDINAAQPVLVDEGHVFISSGYGHGAALVKISETGGRWSAREVWQTNRMKNKFSSSVHHAGYIYGLDEAVLACIDAATGELKWKGGRYGYGQLVLAQGHLIVLTEDGDLVLVEANPNSLNERARFPALEGKTWNHPAFADGLLLVRNLQEMAAFDLRVRPPGP